jgi:hypothetical protein
MMFYILAIALSTAILIRLTNGIANDAERTLGSLHHNLDEAVVVVLLFAIGYGLRRTTAD